MSDVSRLASRSTDFGEPVRNAKVRFFFVGVGKCGTSWLFEFLRRRQIMSLPRIKEPYFLDCKPAKWDKEVASLYRSGKNMADFSTLYYWNPENAKIIRKYNANAKIIITVRKPSSRIISHFRFLQRNGYFASISLSEYLDDGDCEQIVARSEYHDMIERYRSVFGSQNVLILPMEQLKESPQLYVDRLLAFCDIDKVELSEEDLQPVLARSSARSVVVARIAKSVASLMRTMRILGVLAMLKDSKMLRSLLFREDNSRTPNWPVEFGSKTEKIMRMDEAYEPLLKSCYDG